MATGFELVKDADFALADVPEVPAETAAPEIESVALDDEHRRHIGWLTSTGRGCEWKTDQKCLHAHTLDLADMHKALNLKGTFETSSSGTTQRNCFLYPQPDGGWRVVRFGQHVQEADTWHESDKGKRFCYFNVKKSKAAGPDPAAQIVRLAECSHLLFHDPSGTPYVTVKRDGRTATLLVKETAYRHILRMLYTERTKRIAKGEWLSTAIDQLSAIAVLDRPEYEVFVRLAWHDGCIYLDLGRADGKVIKISADGWKPITDPPVRFRRPPSALPLPEPIRVDNAKETANELRPFFNVRASDWPLLLCCQCMYLNPRGPYPLVAIYGRAGCAKTSTGKRIKSSIDPSEIEASGEPQKGKEAEDLNLRGQDEWIIFLDNLSDISKPLSDVLCRLSTGGAHARRKLYADAEQSIFRAKRPVIVASINDVIKAGDLADRVVRFELPNLPERRTERELNADFEAVRGKMLGLLLNGAVMALAKQNETTIDKPLPRLLDFAVWCSAAETGLGLEDGAFMKAYRANMGDTAAIQLDGPLGKQILAMALPFEGTASELAKKLEWGILTDKELKDRIAELRELAPALESRGIDVEFFPPSHGKRKIKITGAIIREPSGTVI